MLEGMSRYKIPWFTDTTTEKKKNTRFFKQINWRNFYESYRYSEKNR